MEKEAPKNNYLETLHGSIAVLAEINALGERKKLTEEQMHARRLIVDALWKMRVIEFEEVKENGKFAFTTPEEQEVYLKVYNEVKSKTK